MKYKWFDTVRFYIKGVTKNNVRQVVPILFPDHLYVEKTFDEEELEFVEVSNGGFTKVVLKGLKPRSKNMYLLELTVDGYVYEFEMSVKSFSEIMLRGVIGSGGVMQGTYSFINVDNETKFVLEDSESYRNVPEGYHNLKNIKKKLDVSSLIPGHVYAVGDLTYVSYLYVGELYLYDFEGGNPTKKMVFVAVNEDDSSELNVGDFKDLLLMYTSYVPFSRDLTEENDYDVVDVDNLLDQLVDYYDGELKNTLIELDVHSEEVVEKTWGMGNCCDWVGSTISRTADEYARRSLAYRNYYVKMRDDYKKCGKCWNACGNRVWHSFSL